MYSLLVDDIQDKNSSVFVYIYHLCEWSWVVSLSSILFRVLPIAARYVQQEIFVNVKTIFMWRPKCLHKISYWPWSLVWNKLGSPVGHDQPPGLSKLKSVGPSIPYLSIGKQKLRRQTDLPTCKKQHQFYIWF